MSSLKTQQNPLGYEKLTKLILKFAVPSVVAMLVSSLYNVVDQIFIGQYVGTIGNAATNIAFPITTVCMAIALLVGVGGASSFSISLGKGNSEEASQCVGNALITGLVLSVVYSLAVGIFAQPMLNLFGATEASLPYALDYVNATVWGIPFLILSNVLNNFIRADGNPNYAMFSMLSGAIVNIGLDALLVPKSGMTGAAVATVISQIISFAFSFVYLFRFKSVKIDLKNFRYDLQKSLKIASLGTSNSLNQVAICAVQIVMTNSLKHYGELSIYGADNVIAAFGVVLKINSILMAIFIGFSQGTQPIIGFNYGAGNYMRSRNTSLIAALICFLCATAGFTAFQSIPETILSVFGSGDALYMEFAVYTMKTFLMMIMLNGCLMIFSSYFSAIGKPLKGVIVSMTRQFLLIIPLILILPRFFGLNGILWAAPITDLFSFVLCAVLIIKEFKSYKKS